VVHAQGELRLIQLYYLCTPLFFMVDAGLGLELRAGFLDEAGGRYGWYALCFGLGLVVWWWPVAAPGVALLESALNFMLLCVAVLAPVFQFSPEAMDTAGQIGLSGQRLAAFVLVGTACIVSFHLALRQLRLAS